MGITESTDGPLREFDSVEAACRARLGATTAAGHTEQPILVGGVEWFQDVGRGWYHGRTCERFAEPGGARLSGAEYFGIRCREVEPCPEPTPAPTPAPTPDPGGAACRVVPWLYECAWPDPAACEWNSDPSWPDQHGGVVHEAIALVFADPPAWLEERGTDHAGGSRGLIPAQHEVDWSNLVADRVRLLGYCAGPGTHRGTSPDEVGVWPKGPAPRREQFDVSVASGAPAGQLWVGVNVRGFKARGFPPGDSPSNR